MVMETYHRKHPKKANQSAAACQKEAAASGTPPSPALSDHQRTLLLKEPQVEVGYLYEIDHKNLPPRTPVHLRSIRVALVCEKTEMNIAVRFPSKESLRAFFSYSTRETHPTLDEKFVMGIACAEKVLVKLVPLESFSEHKTMETFWLVESKSSDHMFKDDNNVAVVDRKAVDRKGSGDSFCSEALKLNGIVRWGIRRQVKYMGRHKEMENDGPVKVDVMRVEGSHMKNLQAVCDDTEENNVSGDDEEVDGDEEGDEDEEEDEEDEEDEEEEEEEEDEEEEEEGDTKIKRGIDMDLKRKRYPFRNIAVKKAKIENLEIKKKKTTKKGSQIKKLNKGKGKARSRASIFRSALVLRDPKDRWSTERYKLAEKNLLCVMKSKKATAEAPILRPQLRAEARKKIGDTGLLDHLLKHMAGRVAPGSNERFRRRHNPDGAMEYWLESADLVGIRKEAGVSDPYWVPPPGWKLGDSPTQDPICARELKILKDEMKKMERDFNETKVKLEEEVGRLRRDVIELSSFKKRVEVDNNQPLTIAASSPPCIMSQSLGQLDTSKFDLGSALVLPVEKYKEQVMGFHDFVKEMEEKLVKALMEKSPELGCKSIVTTPKKGDAEKEKGAKIERMKSGFRICKPEGTFRWPNMVKDNNSVMSTTGSNSNSNQIMVQVEASTPPSVHSSTAPPPHHQLLAMNPLAKKRAVKVTVSTDYNSNPAADLINFNTLPSPKPNHIPLQQVVTPNASSSAAAYYEARRNVMMGLGSREGCDAAAAADHEVSNWLALSTLTSASPDSAHV